MDALKCPECSAPLERPAPGTQTLRCPYCHSAFLLNRAVAGPTPAPRGTIAAPPRRWLPGPVWFVVGVAAVLVGFPLLMSLMVFGVRQHVRNTTLTPLPTMPTFTPLPSLPVTKPAAPEFARLVSQFGSKGVGPGQFQDARSIAIDGAGRIYVGEATGGRVQVFDADGRFLKLWSMDAQRGLTNLAAQRDGTLLAVVAGEVLRFDGPTGKPRDRLETLDARGQRVWFKDICCAASGELYALDQESNIWVLDADAKVIRTLNLRKAVQDDELALERVAVSGDGRLYALQHDSGIYQFDRQGRFINRFAVKDDDTPAGREDIIHFAAGLAVDGQGRVIVADLNPALKVFDRTGRYIGSIGPYGVCFGVAVNDADQVIGSFRNDGEIRKYEISGK